MGVSLSVIIPMHNASGLVGSTLRSMLHQEHPPHEIIVVDDSSTDDSAAEVDQAASGAPVDVKLLRTSRPLGVARARNLGAEAASGDWLGFCDSDDLWHPALTSRINAACETNPKLQAVAVRSLGFAYNAHKIALGEDRSGMVDHWADGDDINQLAAVANQPESPAKTFTPADFALDSCLSTTQVLMTRRAFHLAGGFSPLSHHADEWLLHASLSAFEPIPEIPERLIFYRLRPASASHDRASTAERLLAVMTLLRFGGATPDLRPASGLYETMAHHPPLRRRAAWVALGNLPPRAAAAVLRRRS